MLKCNLVGNECKSVKKALKDISKLYKDDVLKKGFSFEFDDIGIIKVEMQNGILLIEMDKCTVGMLYLELKILVDELRMKLIEDMYLLSYLYSRKEKREINCFIKFFGILVCILGRQICCF